MEWKFNGGRLLYEVPLLIPPEIDKRAFKVGLNQLVLDSMEFLIKRFSNGPLDCFNCHFFESSHRKFNHLAFLLAIIIYLLRV